MEKSFLGQFLVQKQATVCPLPERLRVARACFPRSRLASHETIPMNSMLPAEHVPDCNDGQDGQGRYQAGRPDGESARLHRPYNVIWHVTGCIVQEQCRISQGIDLLKQYASSRKEQRSVSE